MQFTSVTYTSLPALTPAASILRISTPPPPPKNVSVGVTGMLVFNGTHFLQILEGAEASVDALIEHIRTDPRHTGFEICDRQKIASAAFRIVRWRWCV